MNTIDDVFQSDIVPDLAKHIIAKQLREDKKEIKKWMEAYTAETQRAFDYQRKFLKQFQDSQLLLTHLALMTGQPVASGDLEMYNLYKRAGTLPVCCRQSATPSQQQDVQ